MKWLIGSIVFIIVGFLQIFNPDLIWRQKHKWDVKNGEPSDAYYTLSKIGGVLGILMGIFLFIVFLIH